MNVRHGLVGRFNNMSIAKKLSLCFALLGIGLVVVVVVGSNGMGSMSAAHNDVVNVGVPKQLESEQARAAAADMHFSQTRYVLDGGASHSDFLGDRKAYQKRAQPPCRTLHRPKRQAAHRCDPDRDGSL